MVDKVMDIAARILMVVEAAALVFLIVEWFRAKKEQGEKEDGK